MKQHLPVVIAVIAIAYYGYVTWVQVIPGPVVQTSGGLLRGAVGKSREGREFYYFLGIPYAKPPVAELRFEDPQPPEKWQDVREAYQFGSECLQVEVLVLDRVIGSEDCLFLNVYTPYKINETQDDLLPVMVYLHGGLFMGGSSNMYQGSYFMDEDVVLVTLNYRVAALGFLSSGDDVLRGNQGLKDQTLAMKWVQENIQRFGGDPNRVTLFGESAGGACVQYHMISPQSKGLFQQAVAMSGTAMRKYTSTSNQTAQLFHLGARMGCTGETTRVIAQCLKKIDGKKLVEIHREASEPIITNEFALYVPTTEIISDDRSFLPKNPRVSVENGESVAVPFVVGVVAYEGLLYVSRIVRSPEALSEVNQNWMQVLPKLLKYNASREDITRRIKDFYFGEADVLDVGNNVERFADLFSDRLFMYPSYEAVASQTKYSPVHVYYMTYQPQTSAYQLITSITPNGFLSPPLEYLISLIKTWVQRNVLKQDVPRYGPSHGDELSLLFNMHFLAWVGNSHVDYSFSRRLVNLWASFAQGKPLNFGPTKWLPIGVNSSKIQQLVLDDPGRMEGVDENQDLSSGMLFWKSLNLPIE